METHEVVWDPFGPEAAADPPESWRALRESSRMAWSERQGGFWVVSRYDRAVAIARDSGRFNNSGGPQFGTARPPLEVDRPDHTLFRRILQPYFARERVELLEPRVRAYVVEMLQPAIDAGGADLAEVLTYPLPARVLCAWLGLPDAEWSLLKGIAEDLFDAEEGRGDDAVTRARCNEELYAHSRRVVSERTGDLVQGLLELVDEEDVVQVVRLLIVAGHNSTTGALGNCILRLATHRDVQRHLREHPEALPQAIEEFLRLEPSVQAMPRWANEDTELDGCPVRTGDKLMLLWASANRDPEHFDRPDECILDRDPNDHLTFGRGIHRCIGMDLARLELRVALDELLSRTSSFELSDTPVRTTFIRRGVSCLPLILRG
jgi:cytochrome P450